MEKILFWQNFNSRDDLTQYKKESLLIYALELRYGIDDIHTIASESITDGSDDKKIDLVYIDETNERVVIAQSYISDTLDKPEAKENKAHDLNTAVSWLFSMDEKDLPDRIKSHILEVRRLLTLKKISDLQLWYCHNLPESDKVKTALESVQNSANSFLKQYYPDQKIAVSGIEVGVNQIEEFYLSRSAPILVNDDIPLGNKPGYELNERDWSSYSTFIEAPLLKKLYSDFSTKLFSANIRDYLGSRKADKNINNGIKHSAKEEPENFWAYNNGITALVNDYNIDEGVLTISGISIVNGAQTTGAIGNEVDISDKSKIPIRFIKCNIPKIIKNITTYNNSQNRVEPSDFRSKDRIQIRLSETLKDKFNIDYGFRRGSKEDAIKRPKNYVSPGVIAQSLFCLKQDPRTAYHAKNKIWEDDGLYNEVFNEKTTADNVLFSYSLLKAIEEYKAELREKSRSGSLISRDEAKLSFLRQRGATLLFMSAISASLEIIINKKISNVFDVAFGNSTKNLIQAIGNWNPVIDSFIAHSSKLSSGLNDGLRKQSDINTSIEDFTNSIDSIKSGLSGIFDTFKSNL